MTSAWKSHQSCLSLGLSFVLAIGDGVTVTCPLEQNLFWIWWWWGAHVCLCERKWEIGGRGGGARRRASTTITNQYMCAHTILTPSPTHAFLFPFDCGVKLFETKNHPTNKMDSLQSRGQMSCSPSKKEKEKKFAVTLRCLLCWSNFSLCKECLFSSFV